MKLLIILFLLALGSAPAILVAHVSVPIGVATFAGINVVLALVLDSDGHDALTFFLGTTFLSFFLGIPGWAYLLALYIMEAVG